LSHGGYLLPCAVAGDRSRFTFRACLDVTQSHQGAKAPRIWGELGGLDLADTFSVDGRFADVRKKGRT
jgi:hypothetical protein